MEACPRYIPDPVHLLTEPKMCVPDLYTFVKLYGTDAQVQEMATLRKLRRRLLIPIYRETRRNPQRIARFFGRTDLPPVPQPNNNNNVPNQRNNNVPNQIMNNEIPFIFQANNPAVRRVRRPQPRVTSARRRAAELVRRSAIRQRTRDFERFTRNRRSRQEAAENRVRPERPQVPGVRRRAPLVRPVRSVNRADFERFARNRRSRQEPENRVRPERPQVPGVRRRAPLVRPGGARPAVVRSVNRADFERFAQEVRRQTNRARQQSPVVLRRSARLAAQRRT